MRSILFILVAFICLNLSAQTVAKKIQYAKGEMEKEDYKKALKILLPIADKQSKQKEAKEAKEAVKLTGICYLNIAGEEENSLKYLGKAVDLYPLNAKSSSSDLETHFYFGQALHLNNQLYMKICWQIPNQKNCKKQ